VTSRVSYTNPHTMMLLGPSGDFEFKSGTPIDLGLEKYFADPECEVKCFSFGMDDDSGVVHWRPGMSNEPVQPLLDHVARGGEFRAFNVFFEWMVWNRFCVPLYGWPPLQLSQCVDTMAEAAAMNLPQSLGKCALALRLPADKQKDKRGKQLIDLLCCPQPEPEVKPRERYKSEGAYKGALTRHRNWLAKGGRWLTDLALHQELYDYCDQDVVTERAVARKLRRLSEYEREVWIATQEMNLRGVPVDVSDIDAITAIVDAECDHLNDQLAVLTDFAVRAGSETQALRAWINARHPPVKRMLRDLSDPDEPVYTEIDTELLPDMQSETLDRVLVEFGAEMRADVRRAIEIRQAVAQTSTKKLNAMRARVAADGTLKGMYVFHGASTGRDASRGGVNLQNLKQPLIEAIDEAFDVFCTGDHSLARMIYGDQVMDAAVSLVRGVIKAPEGFEFYDADFSSIENRVAAWIAGQEDKLELFRKGIDEYCAFATLIYGRTITKADKAERKFAKPGVLGGMFGQGWRGLIDYAAGMGVKLTPAESQRITKLYRDSYEKVQASWYRFGDVSIQAVQNPGVWFDTGRDAEVTAWGQHKPALPFGRIALMCHRNFLWMRLPSGRKIAWAAPRVEMRMTPWGKLKPVVTVEQQDSVTHQWVRDKLIGSSIFQSAVQATARDVLIHGVFKVTAAGYDVRMRTHDEVTALVPVGFGSPDHFGQLMCVNPEWCPDLPLAYEAWAGPRFKK
jgi:DNA polymerase